jgi:HPt (histidine-containing phosphotransfer) domain-containing protein
LTEELQKPPEKTRAAVSALWAKYSEKIFARVAMLEGACQALQKNCLSEELRQEAKMAAHKLAGSLGTFGHAEGSKLAGEMESILEEGGSRDQAQTDRLSELAESLRKELEHGPPRQA